MCACLWIKPGAFNGSGLSRIGPVVIIGIEIAIGDILFVENIINQDV